MRISVSSACRLQQDSKYDNLGSDRQVVGIVPGAVDVQMDAAMRLLSETSAVEGDPARGKEHGIWHRFVDFGAHVVRARLPLDVKGAARCPRQPRLYAH